MFIHLARRVSHWSWNMQIFLNQHLLLKGKDWKHCNASWKLLQVVYTSTVCSLNHRVRLKTKYLWGSHMKNG